MRGRDAHLDGIRGLAVLLVVLYHCAGPHGIGNGRLLPGGWIGVQVFFVLSGYLITRLLLEEYDATGTVDRRAFYRRRAQRLLPALSVMLAAWLTLALSGSLAVKMLGNEALGIDRSLALVPVVGMATVSYNWALAFELPTPLATVHLWTLSVEEQFYLLLPTVVLVARRRMREIVLVAIVGSLAVNLWAQLHGGERDFIYFSTPTSAIGLLLGAAVAIVPVRVERGRGPAALALLATCALFVSDDNVRVLPVAVVLASVATVLLLLDRPRLLARSWLVYAGRRSYAIYLWNLPLRYFLEVHDLPPPVLDIVLLSGSFALAELSWRLVERRFLVRRERPGKGRAVPVVLSGEGGI